MNNDIKRLVLLISRIKRRLRSVRRRPRRRIDTAPVLPMLGGWTVTQVAASVLRAMDEISPRARCHRVLWRHVLCAMVVHKRTGAQRSVLVGNNVGWKRPLVDVDRITIDGPWPDVTITAERAREPRGDRATPLWILVEN